MGSDTQPTETDLVRILTSFGEEMVRLQTFLKDVALPALTHQRRQPETLVGLRPQETTPIPVTTTHVLEFAIVSRVLPALAQTGLALQRLWDRTLTPSVLAAHRCTVDCGFVPASNPTEGCLPVMALPNHKRMHMWMDTCIDTQKTVGFVEREWTCAQSETNQRVLVRVVDPDRVGSDSPPAVAPVVFSNTLPDDTWVSWWQAHRRYHRRRHRQHPT